MSTIEQENAGGLLPSADEWGFWRDALAGGTPETTPGTPHSGFFRDKNKRAVAIWCQGGEWYCSVTSGFFPRHKDEIDDLFGFVCRAPITRELYMLIANGGQWPEDIPAADRGVEKTDNNPPEGLSSDRALAAEIAALEAQCREWLQGLKGGKPSTKAEADLCANYAERFLSFENRAIASHKAEKQPHLDAGRAVDAKWFASVRDVAATLKTKIKAVGLAWARAEDERKYEETRKANEAARIAADEADRKARDEADKAGAAPPPPVKVVEAVAEKTKIGTGRAVSNRERTVYQVTDAKAFVQYLMTSVSPTPVELSDALAVLAKRFGPIGNVPGIQKVVE